MSEALPEMVEVRLLDLVGYPDWSRPRREEYPEAFAYLDAMTALVSPDQLAGPHDQLFSELYEEVLSDFGLDEADEAHFDLDD